MGDPRRPLMAGNWKMNLNHLEAIAHVQRLAFTLKPADHAALDVAVLPPFTDLRSVQTLVDGDDLDIAYGAQDLSAQDSGAYTGEVSGAMLASLGCTYVLVGHSERRQHHREDDALCRAKVDAAFRHGLVPVLCVGEELPTRQAGGHVEHTIGQLGRGLDGLPEAQAAQVVVAYEPVWAIGTGEVATPQDAQEMAAAIRGQLGERFGSDVAAAVRVLYGGSVKSSNVAEIMAEEDVDGALVGGASLEPDEFAAICRYREHPA